MLVKQIFEQNIIETQLFDKPQHIVMWYSGGKDSNTLLNLLYETKKNIDFTLDVYLVSVPFMIYKPTDMQQKQSVEDNLKFWRDRNINIKIVEPLLPNGDLYKGDDILNTYTPKCSGCEKIKLKTMTKILESYDKDIMIMTPCSTYDFLAYLMELMHICGGFENGWRSIPVETVAYRRIMSIARRCYKKIVIQSKNTITFARPVLNVPSKLFLPYNHENNIPIIHDICKNTTEHEPFKRLIMKAADLFIDDKDNQTPDKPFAEDYDRMLKFALKSEILPTEECIKEYFKSKPY